MIKKIIIVMTAITIFATSCIKTIEPASSSNYLRFSWATAHVTNKQGSAKTIMVESDVQWELSVQAPAPDWMIIDKTHGTGNDSLVITATRDNNTGGYRFAQVIATPVNNSAIPPARLTIVQYDSTYKGR